MNKHLVSQIGEGKYLSSEAYLDEKYILLTPEIPLDGELITRMRAWSFDYLLSDGEVSDSPPQGTSGVTATADAPLAAIDQGRRDSREMTDAVKSYQSALHFAEQLFGRFLQSNSLPIAPVQARVKTLIEQVRDQRRYILRIPELDPGATNYIVDHAVKTALVAIATGAAMKMPPHRLIDLGTAAIVHEIGMVRLPSQLYMSNRELSPKEKKAISTHPVLGFKILRQFDYPMQLCLAILECREHIDGSGYPRGLAGDKLSTYAKLLNPASTFAAMASARPYRPPIDGHTIMKTLLTGRNTRYDNDVLAAMVQAFSLFPFGTYVQLASGHRGVVSDVVPGKARAPLVRIVTDAKGQPVSDQPVVDTEKEQYAVSGVLNNDEVKRLRSAP